MYRQPMTARPIARNAHEKLIASKNAYLERGPRSSWHVTDLAPDSTRHQRLLPDYGTE